MPDAANEPNVRSSGYSIVQGRTLYQLCNAVTSVFTVALPAGYESRHADDDTPNEEVGVGGAGDRCCAVIHWVFI